MNHNPLKSLNFVFGWALSEIESQNRIIIITGGFGSYFNKSDKMHSSIMANNLFKRGIPEDTEVRLVNSHGTEEDIIGVKRIADNLDVVDCINVVTSGYHMDRVKEVCKNLIGEYSINFFETDEKQNTKSSMFEES